MDQTEARLRALMLAGLAGDAAAHRALLAELGRLLRRYYARRLGFGTPEAEDLVQETLIAVHTRRATYDPQQPFTAWAYAIARYKMIDHLRRAKVRPSSPLEEADELFTDGGAEDLVVKRDLDKVLAEVSARTSALIRDVKVEGLSTREAAEKHGLSETAVKVAVHRGLKALTAKFGGARENG